MCTEKQGCHKVRKSQKKKDKSKEFEKIKKKLDIVGLNLQNSLFSKAF